MYCLSIALDYTCVECESYENHCSQNTPINIKNWVVHIFFSNALFFVIYKNIEKKYFGWASVRVGFLPGGQVSGWATVRVGKCRGGQVSGILYNTMTIYR